MYQYYVVRMIVLLLEMEKIVVPLFFYFKGDISSVSKEDVLKQALLVEMEMRGEG